MQGASEPGPLSEPSARGIPRIAPLTRRLIVGVVLGFAAIAVALFGVWASLDRRHRAVQEKLESFVAIEGAASAAAYEMETAITDIGLAVNEYVNTSAPTARATVRECAAEFAQARARFEHLVATPAQRALGVQIASLHERHLSVSEEMMTLHDRRAELRARVAEDFVRLDRTRGEIQASTDSTPNIEQVAALKLDLRELGRELGQFLATPDESYQGRALADLRNVSARIAVLRELSLAPNEARIVERVGLVTELLVVDVREIVDIDAGIRRSERELAGMRSQLEALHRSIQVIAHQELENASKQATLGIRPEATITLIGASVLVASLAGAIIMRRSLSLRGAAAELDAETRRRQDAERDRSQLLERLVSAHEEERARVSRELHDQMGQKLSALVFGLDRLGIHAASDASGQLVGLGDIEKLRDIAGQLLDDAHSVAHQLRPPALTDLGLHGALTTLIDGWQSQYGIPVDFYSEFKDARLASVVETTLYRVVQEALTNVRKHAEARAVSVLLKAIPGSVRLVIDDDGRGFDVERMSDPLASHGPLGLRGIRERVGLVGGTLEFESSPGKGTTLVVVLPIR